MYALVLNIKIINFQNIKTNHHNHHHHHHLRIYAVPVTK